MYNQSCKQFLSALSSDAPVPGGGGASALSAAIGTALSSMVASLTVGKKKYADVQEDVKLIIKKANALEDELLELINEDAKAFEPLSKAYSLPKTTEEEIAYKNQVMEKALNDASEVPYRIMEKCFEAILLHEETAQKGTRIALSDVGAGVAMCEAALRAASLNIYINTGMMKDRDRAAQLEKSSDELIAKAQAKANEVYSYVLSQIRK